MGNVATRLLSLIMLLQSRPCWKASELAAEFNVSERTVHRYMGMLDELGIPIYSERGPYGGFSLVRGYKLPPMIFSAEEATVLYMGANLMREVWGQTYDQAVTSVTAKLDNVLPDDLRHQVAETRRSLVVGELAQRDYRPWAATIHTLRQCIIEHRCLELTYRGFGRQEESHRVVAPYGLFFQWGLWYMVGYCRFRQEVRTFRVDRIQEVKPLDQRFTVPKEFSLRDYMERTMTYEPAYRVEVRLEGELAGEVRDRHGHWMEIADNGDGSITARFSVGTLEWAAGWVLGYGARAKVISPPELVQRVCEAAQGALAQYAPPKLDGA